MTAPFHIVLRDAIRQRGLPLDRLRSHLAQRGIRVGLATLSDWQHGRTWPHPNSVRAIDALEDILNLPQRSLTGLLGTQQGLDEHSGPLGELLGSLPRARAWDLESLTEESTVVVGADHRATFRTRKLVRARRDGVDRAVVRFLRQPQQPVDQLLVTPIRNCSTGRLLRHPSNAAMVYELLFGQPLAAGETWLYEYEMRSSSPCDEFAHGVVHPEGTYVVEVRFHPEELPSAVRGYIRADLYDDRRRVTELTLNTHHAVHLTSTGMTAGVLGIEWEWIGG
ncbi:hypothetical protein Lesp02_77860 [Lentzea sp. NBRC 105346]|uniref:hypothetical protein n=1 Tax=Lentzea sp. NBRC 105346 TaxID=3032205 RepID=UPI0024A1FD1B|nr:hypothetical protein [Lentzea sp. NBRC 105346]GLZ35599.1 hypothetical protein Lesp02_77860 [Lentzea sp. NBRC 105346]